MALGPILRGCLELAAATRVDGERSGIGAITRYRIAMRSVVVHLVASAPAVEVAAHAPKGHCWLYDLTQIRPTRASTRRMTVCSASAVSETLEGAQTSHPPVPMASHVPVSTALYSGFPGVATA